MRFRCTVFLMSLLASLNGMPSLAGQALHFQATEANRVFEPLIVNTLARAGYEMTVSFAPLTRMQLGLRNNTIDGVFFIGEDSLAVGKGIKIPVVLYTNEVVALSLNPGIIIHQASDLQRWRVAVLRGNASQAKLTKGMAVTETDSYETSVKMLRAGHCDIVITSRLLVYSLIKQFELKDWTVHEPPLSSYPLFVALAPGQRDLVPALTQIFQGAVDRGEWQRSLDAVLDRPTR